MRFDWVRVLTSQEILKAQNKSVKRENMGKKNLIKSTSKKKKAASKKKDEDKKKKTAGPKGTKKSVPKKKTAPGKKAAAKKAVPAKKASAKKAAPAKKTSLKELLFKKFERETPAEVFKVEPEKRRIYGAPSDFRHGRNGKGTSKKLAFQENRSDHPCRFERT